MRLKRWSPNQGGRRHARLVQARIRLGRGVVGELPGIGLCLHTRGFKIGPFQIMTGPRPIILLESADSELLRPATKRANARVTHVVDGINRLWTEFESASPLEARRRMAARN